MTNPIIQLQEVRARLAALEQQEITLMHQIINEAKHTVTGERTYTLHGQKVKIKTSENVTLDTATLNAVWNETFPINRSFKYTLRQKDYEAIMRSGAPQLRQQLAAIVTTKPARPSVKIGE